MSKDRLVYKIYRQRREEFVKGRKTDKKNWCYWTWKFLKELNLEHIWESEEIGVGNSFNKLTRELMKVKEESEWRERMQRKSKLRLYRKLKNKLALEEYVKELEQIS